MAYADQQMSGNRITAIVVVVLIHLAVGYVLVTGLAYDAYKKVIAHVATVDVKEPDKKPPPPPPPQKNLPPPPIVAPPPPINVATAPSQVTTVATPPPAAPVLAPVAAPVAPPPPRASKARRASAKNQSAWQADIQENLTSDAVREGSGTVGMTITIGADGRVSDCTPSHSSGKPGLDRSACAGMKRFARYTPALDDDGNPISSTTTQTIRFDLTDSE